MDKFMELTQSMMAMPEEERMKMMEEKKKACICKACPSYNECAKTGNELLYCAVGKSGSCISEEKGCTCGACPVTSMMGLTNTYFCTKGSEKELRGM